MTDRLFVIPCSILFQRRVKSWSAISCYRQISYVDFMYFIFQLMEENLFRLLIMFYGTFSFSSNIETMYLHLSNTVFRLHYTKYLAGLAEVQ